MDRIRLTAEQCVWFLTISEPRRRAMLKKLATGKYELVWDAETHEFVLTPVD